MKAYPTLLISLLLIAYLVPSPAQENPTFRYFVGHSEPDTTWKDLDFDDSSWLQGTGSIGYGDNDDSILIDATTSLYIRHQIRFTEDFPNYKGLIIYPDFDDGYIAYLNNVEVLRVNIADSIKKPNHLQTTNRSHEAFGYRLGDERWYQSGGYFIDSVQLADCAVDTLNLLSFTVFNDSIDGSDLSFEFSYHIVDTAYYFSDDYKNLNYLSTNISDSTILPILVIETDEFGVGENNTIARMGIINDPAKPYNHQIDSFSDYNGRIRIKLHGTYSLQFPKKSMGIELQDSLGENNNVSILGFPKENDFILYAPFQDRTLIKNVFTYNLGRKMGHYAPRTRFCELILNGTNLGVHVLAEKIKRDKNRVDIKKLDSTENSGEEMTGGYLLQYNEKLSIEYPKARDITPEQSAYINDFILQCQSRINNIDYCSSENNYKELIDINSLADYFLINELSYNYDSFNRSWYMFKDRDDVDSKLKYGPLWDYDVAWYYRRGQWHDDRWCTRSNILNLEKILMDTVFTHLVINKWEQYRESIFSDSAMFGLMDSITNAIAPAIERNYRIWPNIQCDEYGKYVGLTYSGWMDETQTWIANRANWMDSDIPTINYIHWGECISSSEDLHNTIDEFRLVDCYPNPFVDELNLKIYAPASSFATIGIYNTLGSQVYKESYQVVQGKNDLQINLSQSLAPGCYMLQITSDSKLLHVQELLKTE